MKRNCEVAAKGGEPVRIANANSLNGSNQSSHSPSVAGESLDVKVEITPAPPTPMSDIQNSFSIESTSSLTICSDNSSKSQVASPNQRKFSEIPVETGGFLNPIGNFSRINPSPPNTASARLFKKLEEMIDLSLPYNHYRCLSPSETNLANPSIEKACIISPNLRQNEANKPGSSRLLRRQFSLDKDDLTGSQAHKNHGNLETISSLVETTKNQQQNFTMKSQYQPLISSSSLPASSVVINMPCNKLQKHQSVSVAQDLEKIEEINVDIPISPINNPCSSNTNDANSFSNSKSNSKTQHQSTSMNSDRKDLGVNIESLGLR